MQRGGLAVGDGSWNLSVFVTDLQVERTLRVRGDIHIGGLMIRLVDELGRMTDSAVRIEEASSSVRSGGNVFLFCPPFFFPLFMESLLPQRPHRHSCRRVRAQCFPE